MGPLFSERTNPYDTTDGFTCPRFTTSADGFWVVTSYFNPIGYQRRLANYHVFRQRLTAPLATIELSFDGTFQLQPEDADLLVQLHAGDILWQKERLLNVLIGQLPDSCNKVAWVDCDVIYLNADWPHLVAAQLDKTPLVQLFSEVHDLPRDADVSEPVSCPAGQGTQSLASRLSQPPMDWNVLIRGSTRLDSGLAAGIAWAICRDVWRQHGLYDAFVLGGGDTAISMAAVQQFDLPRQRYRLNEPQFAHYLQWAEPFHESIQSRVGYLDLPVLHLWHGELADRRRPENRFVGFQRFNFDPATDIALDRSQVWNWNSDKRDMHAFVRNYFATRKEDG